MKRWLTFCSCFTSQVGVERGMSWEEATHAWAEQNGPDDGFYVQVGNYDTGLGLKKKKKRKFILYEEFHREDLKMSFSVSLNYFDCIWDTFIKSFKKNFYVDVLKIT